jgi:hypothetical protein
VGNDVERFSGEMLHVDVVAVLYWKCFSLSMCGGLLIAALCCTTKNSQQS